MGTITTHHCPRCRKQYDGGGPVGSNYQCSCGCIIAASSVDRIRLESIFAWTFVISAFVCLIILHIVISIIINNGTTSSKLIPVLIAIGVMIIIGVILFNKLYKDFIKDYDRIQNKMLFPTIILMFADFVLGIAFINYLE